MKKKKEDTVAMVARYVLGAGLLVFGLNGFFQFLTMPAMPEPAATFMGALMATGYMMYVVKALEVVIGAMLLLNKKTPLALVLLAPLSVNFVLFHIFLAPAGGLLAYVVAALNLYLLWVNKKSYEAMCGC